MNRTFLTAAALALLAAPAAACPTCDAGIRKQIWAAVFGPDFAANVGYSVLPFVVFAGAAAAVHGAGAEAMTGDATAAAAHDPRAGETTRPVAAGALLIGVGLGGFVDGIVFHQILQLHNMLSAVRKPNTVVNIEANMFWDGLFHAFCWVSVAAGLAVLWNAVLNPGVAKRTGTLAGGLLAGFGLFNLVEGVIDHHILHLHHVVETPDHLKYDLMFLASGAVLLGVGAWLVRRSRVRS